MAENEIESRIRDTTRNLAETALADLEEHTCSSCKSSFIGSDPGCAPLLRLCCACHDELKKQLMSEHEQGENI